MFVVKKTDPSWRKIPLAPQSGLGAPNGPPICPRPPLALPWGPDPRFFRKARARAQPHPIWILLKPPLVTKCHKIKQSDLFSKKIFGFIKIRPAPRGGGQDPPPRAPGPMGNALEFRQWAHGAHGAPFRWAQQQSHWTQVGLPMSPNWTPWTESKSKYGVMNTHHYFIIHGAPRAHTFSNYRARTAQIPKTTTCSKKPKLVLVSGFSLVRGGQGLCTNRFHTFSSSEKARRAGGKGEDGREKKKKACRNRISDERRPRLFSRRPKNITPL